MEFSGKNTRVGCHFLLQGILLTQESNVRVLSGFFTTELPRKPMIEIIRGYKTVLGTSWVLQKHFSSVHVLNNYYVPRPRLRILSALSPWLYFETSVVVLIYK